MPDPQENGTALQPQNGTLDSNNDPRSAESDPCLGKTDPKPKKLPFYEKYISDLQEKTGLSRKWVLIVIGLVLGLIGLVIVIIGMGLGMPRVPHMYRYPICRDPACLRAAAQIQENLDSSLSPCTNLWGAVCSKWANNSTRPLDKPVWNQKEQLVQKESERIRDLISTLKLPLHVGTVEWKLKRLYEACLDVETLAIDEARPLMNIISELGGWYILRDWNEYDFDGMKVLKDLQVRYGVSPYFKIHVEPNPLAPNTHSIRISPSGLGLPDREYYYRDSDDRILTAYTDYIRDVVIYISSTRNDATKFGRDIFSYEKRIAEITPDLASLQNPITTYNAISLTELKETNLIPFYDILQAMFPEANISENTDVIVTSLEYLNQISQIIVSTDRRTMNGYLIWTLVREYIPYLSSKYSSAMDAFNSELYGVSQSPERWEMCTTLVKNYMGLASEYLLDQAHSITENTRNIVNDTYKGVMNVIKNGMNSLDDSNLLTQHLKAKLNSLTLHVGLPESTKTPQFIKDYYNSLKIIKSNLFESVKNSIAFKKKIEEKMLLNTLPEGIFLRNILSDVPAVKYVPSKNAVVVPRSLLTEPLYEDGFPSSIVYGRLGTEIAHAILLAILPYGSMWTSDRKILSPFHMTVNDSIRSVQSATNCLSRYILDLKLDVPASRVNETALIVSTAISAVRIANEALQDEIGNREHIHQGGLEKFEDSAIYFLSYAQSQCSETTSQYHLYENIVKFKVSQRTLLHLAWSQLSEFQKAFDCPADKKIQCDYIF